MVKKPRFIFKNVRTEAKRGTNLKLIITLKALEIMKTATLKIELYQFNELSQEAKNKAIEQHYLFLADTGTEYEDEDGNMQTDNYDPTTEEVIESITINEYFFYKNGKLAHTVKYTGGHPLTGLTVYKSKGQKVFI